MKTLRLIPYIVAFTSIWNCALQAATPPPMEEIKVPIAQGPCEPTWKSLGDHFKTPVWWNQAKIGMWLHWGPQSVGEDGDWYAKWIYMPKYAWENTPTFTRATWSATAMAWPKDGNKVVLGSFATPAGAVSDVKLLGAKDPVAWKQTAEGIEVTLPPTPPCKFACCLKVSGSNLKAIPAASSPGPSR